MFLKLNFAASINKKKTSLYQFKLFNFYFKHFSINEMQAELCCKPVQHICSVINSATVHLCLQKNGQGH